MTFDLGTVTVSPLADTPPPFEGEAEFSCVTCGVALEYGGRGRKPKYCDAHKKRSVTGTRTTSTAGNEKLAAMAVEVLCQGNAVIAFGLGMGSLFDTASALSDREDAFRTQAYEALKLDPALCKTILKGGASSGRVALILAYVMLGISVAPVAMKELKEKRTDKDNESQ